MIIVPLCFLDLNCRNGGFFAVLMKEMLDVTPGERNQEMDFLCEECRKMGAARLFFLF